MLKRVAAIVAVTLALGVAQIATAGQLGWWAFDEGSGTTAKDSSGKGNNGTLMNGATWGTGKYGRAVNLDGVDDFVQVPHNAGLCVTKEVTVSVWFNTPRTDGPNASGYQGIIAKGNAPRSYSLYTNAGGVFHFSTGPSGAYIGSTSTSRVPLNEWAHIVVKVEGGQHKYFLNAQAAGVGGANVVLPGTTDTSPLHIGRTAEGTGRSFQGLIDDARIYDLALTDEQIKDLFNGNPPIWPKAIEPSPANGALGVATPLFQWKPGDGAMFHDVYVGTTPDLTEANKVGTRLPFTMHYHASGLQAGATYYWRVDEIAADGSIAMGDVWTFVAMPATAWQPVPPDGAAYMKPTTTLSWTAGLSAMSHDVYVGTNRDDVAGGLQSTFKGNQKVPTLQLDGLTPNTTYYWRVDEIGMTGTKQAGEIWQFTTRPVIVKADPTLVGWWKLEDEGAGVAVDYSGYDRDGTLQGNPQWVEGYLGGAIETDGTDDYVETGYTEDLAKWTVCTWVTSPAAPAATSPTGPVHREKNYQLDWNHTNATFRSAAAMRVGGTWHAASFGTLSGNTWYHLAATFDGTALKAYVNGVMITANPAAAGVPDAETGTLKFGRHSTAAQFFAGTIDDVRVYNRALTDDEITKAMQGDPLLASSPQPAMNANVDIRNVSDLSWSAGEGAAKHDVYFGTDRDAVRAATPASPEYQGRQTGTTFSLAGLVEFGGGAYFWRIDEVKADGTTIHKGNIWGFTVPAYLIVDEFESYTDEEGNRIYETWIDGWTNGTGSTVGNLVAPFAEQMIVHGGKQAMPIDFNNTKTPFYSEAELTFSPLQNWAVEGVTDLSLWFRGNPVRFVDKGNGAFTVSGSGHDIWDNADDFRFVYKRLSGDGSITVKVESLVNTHAWAKAGVMFREGLDAGSPMAYMIISWSSGASFGWRQTANAGCGSSTQTGITAPQWVKLTRTGNAFTAQYSADGKAWTDIKDATGQIVSTPVPMGTNVYVGLCVTSHNAATTTTAQFSGAATTGNVTGAWQQTWIGDDVDRTNSAAGLYVAVEDSAGKRATVPHPDPMAANVDVWTEWKIALSSLTGVNPARIKMMTIGIGNRNAPAADGSGRVYIDDIRVLRP